MKQQSLALQMGLFILSFVLVAFGQPSWSPFLALFASFFGFAVIWRVLLNYPEKTKRFWVATFWYTAVQMVQLSWLTGHPYLYIYAFLALVSLGLGFQFGLLALFIVADRLKSISYLAFVASAWTVTEWARLFFLSGYSWNPVGQALTANLFSLQIASYVGIYGLSFIVIFLNLLFLRAWILGFEKKMVLKFALIAAAPYLVGAADYYYYSNQQKNSLQKPPFHTLLVQTAFPVEEAICFDSKDALTDYVVKEWRQIFEATYPHAGKKVDLIALPEFVVPFGTFTFIYPFDQIKQEFLEVFGEDAKNFLPSLKSPLAYLREEKWYVNNAYLAQALSNAFNAGVVVGLEDAEDKDGKRHYYSSAIYINPLKEKDLFSAKRYAKRVLVPMGEYIPFQFCRKLAAKYGVFGSFTPGKRAQVWNAKDVPFGVSICYEETFGHMMRQNKQLGADFLLNLSSDAWFPQSRLIRQHMEHARLRTVENGMPLVRSCNTGITCVVDALGRDVAVLGDSDHEREEMQGALYAAIPRYTYRTFYSHFGDAIPIGMSAFFIILFPIIRKRLKKF